MIGTICFALLAGVLSILSPCVLPLVPIVLGTAASEHRYGPVALPSRHFPRAPLGYGCATSSASSTRTRISAPSTPHVASPALHLGGWLW